MIATISPRPRVARPTPSDSQNCPSCSSPSPVSTKMRRGVPASRLASAIPLAFEMPMPSEPVFAWMYGVSTCGWPGSPCSRRSWCELLGRQQAEADQHRVERRRVVPLRREEDVAGRRALVEIAHLVQEQPAHDLERAEAGADVARPGAGDHVERVDARQRRERRAPCDRASAGASQQRAGTPTAGT